MLEYTPSNVSDELILAAKVKHPRTIVDFCAGRGSLLESAKRAWPNADLFAVDINPEVMGSFPSASWVCSNFLDHSFDDCIRSKFASKFDLILLNPPFSFNRSQFHSARGLHSDQRCGVAFAFLFTALEYLDQDGELLAIMPTSSLRSDRDAESRQRLKDLYRTRIISPPKYDRFPGLDVSTYLLSIKRKREAKNVTLKQSHRRESFDLYDVLRGKISVKRSHREIQQGLQGWIHTTSVKSSRIVERYKLPEVLNARDQTFLPKGSLVVPRVGKVQPGHLVVTKRREILSDCLLGIDLRDPSLASQLLNLIHRDFKNFLDIYSGTGAPYTTQRDLTDYVEKAMSQLVEHSKMDIRLND